MFSRNIILIMFFFSLIVNAQNSIVKGVIYSESTNEVVMNASVSIDGTHRETTSGFNGEFSLEGNLPFGEQLIIIHLKGHVDKKFPIVITEKAITNIGKIVMVLDLKKQQELFTTIELNSNVAYNDNDISQSQTLLQSNRDAFLSSVAFNWGSTFFKVRGLGNEYSKVLFNGVEMNSFFNHRPNWSNWSGLNDMLRSQEFTAYGQANKQTFGNLVGVNQLQFDASKYGKGAKLSFASTNRSYQGRVMATVHSGQLLSGWAYSLSLSAARGKEGFIEGTSTENFSAAGSISKKINNKHRVNLTTVFTPVKRGKRSPNTQEVIDLKGRKYNSYWGTQNGDLRNSRIKNIKEPIFTINHFWDINKKLSVQNNFLLKTGKTSNSRLEFNGKELSTASTDQNPIFIGTSRNPDPSYYQRLPSFFLRNEGQENFESAFRASQNFREEGQLDWGDLYRRNEQTATGVYALYNDTVEDNFIAVNSILNYDLSSKINLNAKLATSILNSKNYAEITDLLGSSGFLDVDGFSEGNNAQNNLLTPNRVVSKGDKFRYNYTIKALNYNGFFQANFSIPKWDAFVGLSLSKTSYQRIGNYENGNYPGQLSLGKSKKLNFIGYGFKMGATYQLTNKLYASSSLNFIVSPPTIRQSFSNPRQNNDTVIDLAQEQQLQFDGSLNYQYGRILARLSGYYITRNNMTDISFFFTENIASLNRNDSSAFIQEIITGVKTLNRGIEVGAEIQATSELTVNLSMAYGKHIFVNNPNLYITSDSFEEPLILGESSLRNYRLANGPQQVYGLGFSYRDPSYWWFSTQLNYFLDAFIDISPFTRTQNFATDIDGQPLLNYTEERARELLKQEDFGGYFLWNAIGGKSWKTKNNNYIGFTLGIQNILNQIFKTGGFEQSRNSNFNDLNQDRNREFSLFGNRFWLGNGTTYYVNTYWRF